MKFVLLWKVFFVLLVLAMANALPAVCLEQSNDNQTDVGGNQRNQDGSDTTRGDIEYDNSALEAFAVGNAHLGAYTNGVTPFFGALIEAIGHYDRAIQSDPDFVEAIFNKGVCLIRLGSRNPRGQADFAAAKKATDCFDRVLELRPSCADALFAKGQAQYRIGAGQTTPGGGEWKKAIEPAIATLESVQVRFPNTIAADKARKEIDCIRSTASLSDLLRNRREGRTRPPAQEPMHLSATKTIEAHAAELILRIKTGVIADENHVLKTGSHASDYTTSGRIENTDGLLLHSYSLRIAPLTNFNYTFNELQLTFSYDGETAIKKTLSLPDAEVLMLPARSGKPNNQSERIIEYENVRISVTLLDADSEDGKYYKSLEMKVLSEIVE